MAAPSLSAIVNAAGGLLFVLVGVAILLLARGKGRGLLVGGLAAAFGATYAAQNLLPALAPTDAGSWILASLASIAAALSLPVASVVLGESWPVIVLASVAAVAVVFLHQANIARLVAGTENRFRFRRAARA